MSTNKISNLEYFVCAIALAMQKYGVTQKELSQATGINQGRISEYISGKTDPGFKKIVQIAESFNLDIIEFFSLVDETQPSKPTQEISTERELELLRKIETLSDRVETLTQQLNQLKG